MELKYIDKIKHIGISNVVIVPLWNWNFRRLRLSGIVIRCNRTFMELKSSHSIGSPHSSSRCNRTFMELKYTLNFSGVDGQTVVIVPLWNWNMAYKSAEEIESLSCNRTFMELKYGNALPLSGRNRCNRTFMELKSPHSHYWHPCRTRCNRTFMELKFPLLFASSGGEQL